MSTPRTEQTQGGEDHVTKLADMNTQPAEAPEALEAPGDGEIEDHVTKLADMNTQPDDAASDEDEEAGETDDDDALAEDDPFRQDKPRKPGLPDETMARRD